MADAFSPPMAPVDWLRRAAREAPQETALVVADGSFDYRTLASLSAQLCHVLESRGLGAGATLAVESRSPTLLTLLLYSALFADLVLFPLDPRLPDGYRRELLQRGCPDLIIVEDDAVRPDTDVELVSATRLLTEAAEATPLFAVRQPPSPASRRLLMASSGSGGRPHLVALDDANLVASVTAVNERLGVTQDSLWLDCLPLVHIGGLAVPLRCVAVAATVVLHDGFNAAALLADLNRLQVTHLSLVPPMLAQLLDIGASPPPSLQVALVGGAPLLPSLAQRALAAGWPLWVSYGMTETTSTLAARRLSATDPDPARAGAPLKGFEVRILDGQGRVTAGEGSIEVRGAAVHGSDYGPGRSWYATGDRGRLDSGGDLRVLGRDDLVLLSGGEKVHPEAVERLLCRCPGVDEVAVTGRSDPVWGERVVAVYRGDIDEAAFERLCREAIDGVMRPRQFLRVEALPHTANGKLDRAALRQLVERAGR